MKKIIAAAIVTFSVFLLGCGFHLRNNNELPEALHTLYINAANPDDPISVGITQLLAAMNVRIVTSSEQSDYTLTLSKPVTTQTQPSLSDLTLATSASYSESLTATLVDNKTKKVIISNAFSASITQLLNQNQIATNSSNMLSTQDLPRDLTNDIYLWLITQQVHHAINPEK